VFSERLHERAAAVGSRVCLGIDPRAELHDASPLTGAERPDTSREDDAAATARAVTSYFRGLLDATADLIACCKPQSAFFEALGLPGLEALASLTAHARTLGVPVILDAKRGDIDSTAAAYASAYLTGGRLAGDALTINPYLGMDSLEPFITTADDSGRGVFVLLKTSNSGSVDLQDVPLASGVPLYRHLANMLAARAGTMPRDEHGFTALGVVVGATHASHLAELRSVLPRSVFLVPGYGAQGGTADDVAAAFDGNGRGAVVSASRSLTYASGPVGDDPTGAIDAARGAVVLMRDAINGAIARR